jgi:hypothetical protein
MNTDTPDTVILATRISAPPARSDIEILCLRKISSNRYRLYTTTSLSLNGATWDLDPVEFHDAYDPNVLTYLIESFWRLEVSATEIQTLICQLPNSPSNLVFGRDIRETTLLEVLLAEVESRFLMFDASGDEAAARYQSINTLLEKLHRLPFFSTTTRARLRRMSSITDEFQPRQNGDLAKTLRGDHGIAISSLCYRGET